MLALALTVANGYPVMGAKKASLAFKKLTLTEGQTKKIQIKNKNKKAVYKFFSSSEKWALSPLLAKRSKRQGPLPLRRTHLLPDQIVRSHFQQPFRRPPHQVLPSNRHKALRK